MMVFFEIWPENIKKAFKILQALKFKLNHPNQTCLSLKLIMQLTETIVSDSVIFIEKKKLKIGCGQKVNFVKNVSYADRFAEIAYVAKVGQTSE